MTNECPFLGKITKVFVISVVLASVSFGAFGLGRALDSKVTVQKPKNAYYAAKDGWQDIPYFLDRLKPGADWDNLITMVDLRLPEGKYLVTSGAYVYNGDTIEHRLQCWLTTSNGASTGMFTWASVKLGPAGDEELFSQTVPVIVTGESAKVLLKCGSFEEAAVELPEMNKAYVSAIQVTSLKQKYLS